jgi:hypothetical protein
MPMKMKTSGWSQTEAGLKELRRLVQEDDTHKAVRAAARVVSEEMGIEAPVLDEKTARSTALDPGALKAGIRVNEVRKIADGLIRALMGPRKGTRRAAHLVEYGHRLIRGGTSSVGPRGATGPGKLIGDVPAHPFLRPAYEASWRNSLERFAAELKLQLARFIK